MPISYCKHDLSSFPNTMLHLITTKRNLETFQSHLRAYTGLSIWYSQHRFLQEYSLKWHHICLDSVNTFSTFTQSETLLRSFSCAHFQVLCRNYIHICFRSLTTQSDTVCFKAKYLAVSTWHHGFNLPISFYPVYECTYVCFPAHSLQRQPPLQLLNIKCHNGSALSVGFGTSLGGVHLMTCYIKSIAITYSYENKTLNVFWEFKVHRSCVVY